MSTTMAKDSAVLAYSLRTAVAATGLSRTHLNEAINTGKLKSHRSSEDEDGQPQGKYVILADDLRAYLAALPEG